MSPSQVGRFRPFFAASRMASRTLVRLWASAIGKPPRPEVMRKWLYAEDAPEVFPLLAATSCGVIMALTAIGYNLVYNPSVMYDVGHCVSDSGATTDCTLAQAEQGRPHAGDAGRPRNRRRVSAAQAAPVCSRVSLALLALARVARTRACARLLCALRFAYCLQLTWALTLNHAACRCCILARRRSGG